MVLEIAGARTEFCAYCGADGGAQTVGT